PVPSTTLPPSITKTCTSSPLSEEVANVGDEEIGFLQRREVTAAIETGVTLHIETRLCVRTRNAEDLLREDGNARRHWHVRVGRSEVLPALRFAIEANGRVDRV